MTPSNKPGSGESIETKKIPKIPSIQTFLQRGIEKAYNNTNGVFDPKKLNTISWENAPDEIKKILTNSMNDGDEEFDGITQELIDSIANADIRFQISKKTIPLLSARKITRARLYQKFPTLDTLIAPKKLQNIINQKDENELGTIIDGRGHMLAFLQDEFGIKKGDIEKKYEIEKIFNNTNLQVQNPALFGQMQDLARSYSLGKQIDTYTITALVDYFSDNSTILQKLCEIFDLDFTLEEASNLGVIDDNDIGSYVASAFDPGVWATLTKNQKDQLIDTIKDEETYRFSYNELRNKNWHQLQANTSHFIAASIKQKLYNDVNEINENKTGLLLTLESDPMGNKHPDFLLQMRNKTKISGIENLKAGSILAYDNPLSPGQRAYISVEQTDLSVKDTFIQDGKVPGVSLRNMTGKGGTLGKKKNFSDNEISYDAFGELLAGLTSASVLTPDQLQSSLKTAENPDGTIVDTSEAEDRNTLKWFTDQLNSIDPDGKDIALEVGIAFRSKNSGVDGIEVRDSYYTITSINPPDITISTGESASFSDFVTVAKDQGFRRIPKMTDPKSLIDELEKYGVDGHHTHLSNDGDLVTEIHEDDGHGHGKSVEKKYEFFQATDGSNEHIRLMRVNADGTVLMGEWRDDITVDVNKIQQDTIKGAILTEKTRKSYYKMRTMSYAEFLDFLKENKLKATTEDILDKSADYKAQNPHLEDNWFKSYMTKPSIADIIKGFSSLLHGAEHYMEKGSKLNASRFALKMGRKLGLPADIMAQLQSDEVSSVKEIIEKIRNKLGDQNGPVGRKKALHIAHSSYSRPEEVAASMLYMMNGYGALYAEDIAYAQGSESFVNGFLNACGFHGAALTAMKKSGIAKFKADLGNEPGAQVTEEAMIWGILKTLDGKSDEYPIAATVAKAMGGPSGWEKAWRKEGYESAKEKGVRQTADLVNIRGRVNKGLSALATHEYHTAMGMMEKVPSKDPSPKHQDLPVIWALLGYSQHLSTKAQQDIVQFAYSKGHSFHAYAFLRNKVDNDAYRETFIDALDGLANTTEIAQLRKDISLCQYSGHDDPKLVDPGKRLEAINRISQLWQRHSGRGLHDRLQLKNSWMVERANTGNANAKSYIKDLGGVHVTNSGQTAHSDDGGWFITGGNIGSPIVHSVIDDDGKTLNSFAYTMKKVQLDSHKMTFSSPDQKERFWDPIVDMMSKLRNNSNSEIAKAQYMQYRKDILERFNSEFSATTRDLNTLKKQPYYEDFQKMGIDISIIFGQGDIRDRMAVTADRDYQAWTKGGYPTNRVGSLQALENRSIAEVMSCMPNGSANDSHFQKVA